MSPRLGLGRGLAVALPTVVAVLLLAAPAHAASGSITDVSTDNGRLELVFSASGLPTGATLAPGSVHVTVDGVPVTATVTPRAQVDRPLPVRRAVLAVDTSGSMKGAGISAARAAANAFLDRVPADVEVGVVAFDDTVRTLVGPTRDRAAARAAVRRLGANAGDTSLYDAVVRSVAELGDAPQRSLIVLSDGADNHSRASLQAAVDTVARGKVGLDLVAFRTKDSEVAALQRIADGTGGRVRTAGDAGQLATAFAAAAQSFDVQVVLSGPLPGGLSAGGHTAHVSLSYGGQELSASHLVELATGTASPSVRSAPLPRLQVTATSAWIWAVLAVVFLALLALAFAVFAPVGESTRVRRRRELEFYTLSGARQRVVTEQAHTSGGVAQTVLQFSDRVVQSRGLTEQIALQLDRADMRLRPNEWLVLRASISVGAVALLMVLSKNLLVALVLGLALGWLGTHVYLAVRISRRLKRFEEAMPDTLQLVASSLQTGFSLPQALDAAVKDGREPIAGELGRALAEARLGAPLEDALDRVADRMDSPDFRWTVMAVRIQRQVGGNLAEVLQTTVHTMRERGYLRRQVKTLSAEGRLSAYILLALPIGLFAYLYAFRRPYISLLWTQPLGLGMSVVGVLLMVGGTFWMRQTVKVEV